MHVFQMLIHQGKEQKHSLALRVISTLFVSFFIYMIVMCRETMTGRKLQKGCQFETNVEEASIVDIQMTLLCAVRSVLKFTQAESWVFRSQIVHKILPFLEIF